MQPKPADVVGRFDICARMRKIGLKDGFEIAGKRTLAYILDEFETKSLDVFLMPSKIVTRMKSHAAIGRAISWVSWAYLCLLMVVSLLLFAVSENWWFSSALTYAPRLPYLVPALALLIVSCLWYRSSFAVNLISTMMVAVPIMGLSLPVSHWMSSSVSPTGKTLKVISCNVQEFRPDFAAVLAEISRCNPDVVAFQDARRQLDLLQDYFKIWHVVRDGEYFVASRFPVKMLSVGHMEAFDRDAVMLCELELPSTKVLFFNVHQMTPRHGLRALDISSPITQRGTGRLSQYLDLRAEEASALRDFVEGNRGRLPTLIVGDFNVPCESSLYHKHWQGFQNAFNIAGTGYGYSFPCTRQYCWPSGMPWLRLDHILADEAWQVRSCFVGKANGSDHHLIAATLELPE